MDEPLKYGEIVETLNLGIGNYTEGLTGRVLGFSGSRPITGRQVIVDFGPPMVRYMGFSALVLPESNLRRVVKID